MSRRTTIAASALALSLTLGAVWTTSYANAAAGTGTSAETETAAQGELGRPGGGHGKIGFFANNEAIADALGLTTEELQAALKEEGATLASIAEEQGVDADGIAALIVSGQRERLDERLEAGTITQDEYDTIVAGLEDNATALVNGELTGLKGGFGGGHGKVGFFANNEAVAEALGLTTEELQAALKEEGATLASIAEEQGVDADDIAALIASGQRERLDEQLEAGKITQDQYDTIAGGLEEKAAAIVNGELAGLKGGFGGKRMKDEASETAEAAATSDDEA
ncbi:hypothetical protein ACFSL6_12005 [Paenibacillus thailandensis]|uniref:Uncharacterized protein n=1 Tax=Paenibacillus thailandensis TaxID=393250 RepID=A0ABW5QZG3_9BACL